MTSKDKKLLQCPDCNQMVQKSMVKQHIVTCKMYRKKYLNTISRTIDITSKNNLKFMIAELELAKDKINAVFSDSDNDEPLNNQNNNASSTSVKKQFKNSMLSSNEQIKSIVNYEKQQIKNNKNNPIKESLSTEKKDQTLSAFDRILSKKKDQTTNQKSNQINTKIEQNSSSQKYKQMDFMDELFQHKYQSQNKMKFEQDTIICSKCNRKFTMNQVEEFVYGDLCLHPICKKCISTYLDKEYVNAKGMHKYPCPYPSCNEEIPYYQLKEIFGQQKMDQIENELMNGCIIDLVNCVKCKSKFQFLKGKPQDAPKTTEDGKKVDGKYLEDFANNRFLCQNCKTQQCKNCQTSPYHFGKTCEQHKILKTQKKCRYCNEVLPLGYTSFNGIRAFDDVCDRSQCVQKIKNACSKIQKCGHSCNGFIREQKCLPCLKEKCALMNEKQLNGQNEDSYCNICFIEGLGNAPCVKIKCGHIFHFDCLLKRLKTRWFGPRILFNFCHCPLCKEWIQVPQECQLNKILQNYKQLEKQVKERALKRLKFQKDDQNQKLKDPTSQYYKNQEKYAMAIYAYFQCWKCKKPYFGGRKSCADAMNDNREGGEYKPEQLICPQCCPVSVSNCSKHGKQFISFKCKFCCSIAQWFCWGSTHFCDPCHKRQVAGEYLNKIPKQKLPICEGPGKCPIGGNHDGNGETRSLGCSLCTNLSNQNF